MWLNGDDVGGPWSNEVSMAAISPIYLAAPVVELENVDATSINVLWNSVSNATAYEIQRKDSVDTSWTTLSTNTVTTNYISEDLVEGRTYTYRVRAYAYVVERDNNTYGSYSTEKSRIAFLPPVLDTPTLAVANYGTLKVKLTFGDVASATGYQIQRKFSVNSSYTTIATITEKEFIDTVATGYSDYDYRVRAYAIVNGMEIYSPYSEIKTIRATPAISLTTPTVTLENVSNSSLQLSWNNITNAEGYEVQRKDNVNTSWITLSSAVNTNTYLSEGLLSGRTYTYRVRAYVLVQYDVDRTYSGYSSEKSLIVFQPPVLDAPSVTVIKTGVLGIKVNWNSVSGATNYEVQAKSSTSSNWTTKTTTTSLTYTDTGLTNSFTYDYRVRAKVTVNGVDVFGPYSDIKTITPTKGPDGRIPVSGFIDGSQVRTKNKADITAAFGTPAKTYTVTNGEVLVYNAGSTPLKFVRLENNIVFEVYNSDPAKTDMYGIKVGDSYTTVNNKLIALFGSSNVYTVVNEGVKVRINVSKPYYDDAVISYYHLYNDKVEAFQHIAYSSDGSAYVESFDATKVNEGVAGKLVIDLTNEYRRKNGVAALTENTQVTTVAKNHSLDMHVNNFFSHNSYDGKTPAQRLTAGGVSAAFSGENIAAGNIDPVSSFYQWVNSQTGHRENLINANHKQIGVGVIYNAVNAGSSMYLSYYTQVFTR